MERAVVKKTKGRVKKSKTVLLICDMLNDFDFDEAGALLPHATKAAEAIAKLKVALKRLGIPAIYVNDNFDLWLSDWKEIWQNCTQENCKGRKIATLLQPQPDDFFILKPKHSGFHFTSLEVLLKKIGAKRLIITGIAGNICVLFTAHDAHMLEYEVVVPSDCVASNSKRDNDFALLQLKRNFQMKTPRFRSLIKLLATR
jgi:nicotinamidase-related amidase